MKDFKKRLLSGVVVGIFILLPGLSGKVKAKSEGIRIEGSEDSVTSQRDLVMYSRPDFYSHAVDNIRINSNLFRILEAYNFDLVNYNDKLGFIPKNMVQRNSFRNSNIAYEEVYKFGKTTDSINLRVGPSTDYKSLGIIKSDEIIEVIYAGSNGWNLVDYKGVLGFVASQYTKIVDYNKLEKDIDNLPKVIKKAIAIDNVNIRELPSAESPKLGVLKKKKSLMVKDILDNGWVMVTDGENIGYVKSDYVKIIDGFASKNYKNIYMKHEAMLYNYPYQNEIAILPKYEMAFVYGEIEDFYLVETEKGIGYIKKNDTKNLENIYAVVDISSQVLKIYDGRDEILSYPVVTGKNSTPTDLGIFKVNEKKKNYVLTGEDYEVSVKYWLRYNDGEGIHDASWQPKFGGNYYQENGSHGCVNVSPKNMGNVYNNMDVGDKVLVKR